MIDERMLAIWYNAEVATLPFIEKVSNAVAFFCVYRIGSAITGSTPGVAMSWLESDGTCWRFAHVVDNEPLLSFPGNGNDIFREYVRAEKAAGRLHDPDAEIPPHIVELLRTSHNQYVTTGSPMLDFEEVISRDETESILRSLGQLHLDAMDPDPERRCVDGLEYRILIRTTEGRTYDLYWSENLGDDDREQLGTLGHMLFRKAWERSKPSSNKA